MKGCPTKAEIKEFGDVLEEILTEGIHDLEGIVKALNKRKFLSLNGRVFSENIFQEDLINIYYLQDKYFYGE